MAAQFLAAVAAHRGVSAGRRHCCRSPAARAAGDAGGSDFSAARPLADACRALLRAASAGLEGGRALSKAGMSRSNTAGPTISTDRLPALAADLVRLPVAVIVAEQSVGARGQGCHDDSDRVRERRRPGQGAASSRASTGRAARSRAWSFSRACWRRSASNCCASLCPKATTVAAFMHPEHSYHRRGAARCAVRGADRRAADSSFMMSAAAPRSKLLSRH